MMRDLDVLLRTIPIHLMIVDDCDRLVDNQSQRINDPLVDLLVDMQSSVRMSMVLVGRTEETELLFAGCPKLKRRVGSSRYLTPFTWDQSHPETLREYCSLLRTIDQALPFDESGLGQEDMALRLMYATGGFLGWTMKLIHSAATLAITANESTIDKRCLARAYEECIATSYLGLDKINPFLPGKFTYMPDSNQREE
jgi:hypothetical protein